MGPFANYLQAGEELPCRHQELGEDKSRSLSEKKMHSAGGGVQMNLIGLHLQQTWKR